MGNVGSAECLKLIVTKTATEIFSRIKQPKPVLVVLSTVSPSYLQYIYVCPHVYLSIIYITSIIRRHQETPQKDMQNNQFCYQTVMVILLVLSGQSSQKADYFSSSVLLRKMLFFMCVSVLARGRASPALGQPPRPRAIVFGSEGRSRG
jgi:hypothetical protein